jgi:hypothetical protein
LIDHQGEDAGRRLNYQPEEGTHMRTPATYTDRAQLLINARRGIGDPELIESVAARDRIIAVLASYAKRRRYAVKLQQKIDRAMESYIRINHTDWEPSASEAERAKFNRLVGKLIEKARTVLADIQELRAKEDHVAADQLALAPGIAPDILQIVQITDASRAPADEVRKSSERHMLEAVRQLPVAAWIESVHGIGLPGLALLVAEAAALDSEAGRAVGLDGYLNPAKLWKRLGYAPFDGHAGSTWKRDSWRPRKLTDEEWIAAPFSGSRYAVTYTLSLWLVNHQWEAPPKDKDGNPIGEGHPTGPYGEIYYKRRKYTDAHRPDWTDDHKRKDGLRIAFKQFLVDLWKAWIDSAFGLGHQSVDAQVTYAEAPVGRKERGELVPRTLPADGISSKKRRGQVPRDAQVKAAATAAGQEVSDIPTPTAGGKNGSGQSGRVARKQSAATTAAGRSRRDTQTLAAGGGSIRRKSTATK